MGTHMMLVQMEIQCKYECYFISAFVYKLCIISGSSLQANNPQ